MKRLISVILAALLLAAAFALAGCAGKDPDATVIRIAALKGPTGMGVAPLMNGSYSQYNVTIGSDPSAVTSQFISGEYDVAALPVNVASVLYNKLDGDVVILGITTLGVLYVLENGSEIDSVSDLVGKTLYATGQGSTPEYVLNYILKKNGILGGVTVQYLAEHSELATLMANGDVVLGMMPEPNVTSSMMLNQDLRVALDLTEEWNKVSDHQLVQGVLVARRSFVKEHETLIRQLMKDYKAAADIINTGSDEAAKMIVDAGILPKLPIAKAAIPRCNIVFITGREMRKTLTDMFEVLLSADPKSIGGKLPGSDIYFK
ncbi:MAG: ABC transporter substrate-binding protein [Clostridia bacterium]|nr:ABC transporter substrate-binding protein [Clostridia bacterium]